MKNNRTSKSPLSRSLSTTGSKSTRSRSSTPAPSSMLSSLSSLSTPSPITSSSRSIAVKGHLTKVVMDRHKAVQKIKLSDIRPKNVFTTTPSKENHWTFPRPKRPANLYHRVLSYVDQFDTLIPPRQIIHHFENHPNSRVPKRRVYAQMNDLINAGAMYKSVRTDEEGTQHYFYGTTQRARLRHANRIEKLMKLRKPLPKDEKIWQNLEELDFDKR